ncbi:serine protease [Stieleria marina]|uniref:Serine protease n=1 Tax=Stieleria marina TaxID=1930275 RepID=A0A517P061_9BACT|nr:hypothetical protein K239x_47720 [Planctomycetes bacterium K23_9]
MMAVLEDRMSKIALLLTCGAAFFANGASAQSVCLPLPRLLTVTPMGAQTGRVTEVVITGESIEEAAELVFSHPGISAKPKVADDGKVMANTFVVDVAGDCDIGVYEARVMTRLGLSSPRAFSVGDLKEVNQTKASATLETVVPVDVNSICNAAVGPRQVNHYSFSATKGQRVVIDCAANGIDSRLNPVIILADSNGSDLRAERRGGVIDYTFDADGKYVVKVHDLTFSGGPHFFYRLSIREVLADTPDDQPVERLASTRSVQSHSWPPAGLPAKAALAEIEPNDTADQVQKIELPCDIAGRFYPAADVDRFQFSAKQGEVWWIEVASERLGRPTDPTAVVQRVSVKNGVETTDDVIELTDIPSPVKLSTYAYTYNGPPYNSGSTDILGKLEIPQDGVYRLQLNDLLGGTRTDPRCDYRMVIRKASPDFSIVMWGLHMQLRNGDRNALSKPLALRGGDTRAMEVVAIRRDGFKGPIQLALENLPDGVTAEGLTLGTGQSQGTLLVTAAEGAPRGYQMAKFVGRATIDGQLVQRVGHAASMAWPVRNARDEVTQPRLLVQIPVSVGGEEVAPITIAAKEEKVWEAKVGEKIKVPLIHLRRGEFSGANIGMKTFGAGFERNPKFDLPIAKDHSETILDLAALKTKPGDYTVAFYGGAVAKHVDGGGANAKPKDIAEIIVSQPISIRVLPAETP